MTLFYTWWGKDQKHSFCTTRIVSAIYGKMFLFVHIHVCIVVIGVCVIALVTFVLEAACNNTNFKPPTRLEFHKVMKETLRTAQERCRSRNKHRTATVAIREYWNDNTRITTENTENIEPETNVRDN